MRKLVLFAAVLVLVALMLLLARGLISPAEPVPAPDPAAEPEVPATTGELDAGGGEAARSSLAEASSAGPLAPAIGNTATHTCSLRIHVTFAGGPRPRPASLEVRVSDMLGVQRDAQRESPLEFLVPRIPPGEYVVVAMEASSIGATRRVRVTQPGEEVRVDIALESQTLLAVLWRTPDERPQDLVDGPYLPGRQHFAAHASRTPLRQEGPRPESVALASFRRDLLVVREESTATLVRVGPARKAGSTLDPKSALSSAEDPLGMLVVPLRPPFWVSVWSNGFLVDMQEIGEGQTEVVFTMRPAVLVGTPVPVSYCLVDEAGGPVYEAIISIAGVGHLPDSRLRGCGTLAVAPGWHILRIGPHVGIDAPSEPFPLASIAFRVHTLPGKPLDLGQIRLSVKRTARFGVVDANGRGVTGAEFTIVRLSTYDGTEQAPDLQRAWSDAAGMLTFDSVAPEKYVVTCSSPRLDAAPFVFDGARIGEVAGSIVGTITVQPVRQISLAFDEPPPVHTLVVIETPEGLPVRCIEVDEFGIVPLWLGGTDYKFHLVVEGERTESRRFSVTSDPFVLEIGR